MKPENTTTILTVKEAAERWKISYGSLVRMIHANEIPFIQIGKRSYRLREEDFIQAMTAARPKGPVEKLADMIRDFPAEDIWEMERYAEFLEAKRELPKKKKATTGPMGTELPENWRRA
jgi:excisionase family DNA binding protein